ncbi:hypothetical protein BGZ57DRAFT_998627 [Hyaloscypha finlandica]|nr:hypothetical protein BGZ57DRAFT_998627 [Hyaloscypha finlandica]
METPTPPIFDEHLDPGVRLRSRQNRLEEYLIEVTRLEKKILNETGQRIITKERWNKHFAFKTEKEGLELRVAELQSQYEAALTEQAGLSITDGSEQDVIPGLQKILRREEPIPAPLMQEVYAMILHEHKSLDFVRHVNPVAERVLFNYELQPLRDALAKLKQENYELRQGGKGTEQIQVENTPVGLVSNLQKELEDQRRLNQQLIDRFGNVEQATQRIAETQLNQVQNSPSIEESLACLKKQVIDLRADLATKNMTIQIQQKKIDAFQRNARASEDKAQAGILAVENYLHSKRTIKELEERLQIKEYDLNSSLQLNDFLKTQHTQLSGRAERLTIHYEGLIKAKDQEIRAKDEEITDLDSWGNMLQETVEGLCDEADGPAGLRPYIEKLELAKAQLEEENKTINYENMLQQEKLRDVVDKGKGAQSAIGKLVIEKASAQRELKNFKNTLKDFLSQALPLARGDDKLLSSFIDIWRKWTVEELQPEREVGSQDGLPWIIRAPVTPTSAALGLESSSTISLAAKFFVLVHTRRHAEPLALGILPELIRRFPRCEDSWAARIVVECIVKFYEDRKTVVETMETASVSLSLLQLYYAVVKRFPKIKSQMTQESGVLWGLRDYARKCDSLMGEVCDKLCSARSSHTGISALQSTLKERMVQYPLNGLCLISDTNTEWVIVISEGERAITLTSKLLFRLDDENTTLTQWGYSVKEPSELSDVTFIDDIDADDKCHWWQKYILNFVPYDDELKTLLEGLKLT